MTSRDPAVIRVRERGFAMLAALGALALFSGIAFISLARDRGTLDGVAGLAEQARLAAAADAGLMLAVNGLAQENRTRRWPVDGRTQALGFDGLRLSIAVEDERGKIPLDVIDMDQAGRMFEAAGAAPARARDLATAFAMRRDGAPMMADDRPPPRRAPPNAATARAQPFRTVEELVDVPGVDAGMIALISPVATVDTGERGGFDPSVASPFAIRVMSGETGGAVASIERRRELAGERAALDIAPAQSLVGHPLMVRVLARDGAFGRLMRATVIEFLSDTSWRIRYRL